MWKDLTLQQKAKIMQMSVANGVTDINDIQQLYDDSLRHRFDEGGYTDSSYINNDDLELMGWYWAYPDIASRDSDPLYASTQGRENEAFLYDRNTKMLVPKSTVENYISSKSNNSVLPEVVHEFDTNDQNTINAATRLWGDSRQLAYNDMSNNPEEYPNPTHTINTLDTIVQNTSEYPRIQTVSPEKARMGVTPDGRVRASYSPYNKTIELDENGERFVQEYESELAHHYQYNSGINKTIAVGDESTPGQNYDKPGTVEYAHKVTDDPMYRYTSGELDYPYYYKDFRDDVLHGYQQAYSTAQNEKENLSQKALGGHLYNNGSYFGKVLPELEVIGTRPNRPNKNWRDYQSQRLKNKWFNSIMPTYWDTVGGPMEYILQPFERTYGWLKDTQPDLYNQLLYSTLGPEFMSYNTRYDRLFNFANGGHLYEKAGPLDKAKQQPKYQYGIIEQILRENGVNFRVTSGARKPNQAGNAGKGSAHTYTIFGDSPGAIDIVPGVGSDWNTLFAQMNSPRVRRALAAYGLDVLNETNPSVMASTHATGPHLHVGRGIKGQSGTGQMFGGTSFGGGKGSIMPQYSGDNSYASMIQQQAMEPITLAGSNATSPWLDYIGKIGQQRPITFNTPVGTSNGFINSGQIDVEPVNFSNIGAADELMSFNPYARKQAIEYNLGLDNNAIWNSPYLLFNSHDAANGGYLFDDGSMLLKNGAINPLYQYVYGPDYERIVKRNRDITTKAPVRLRMNQRVYSTKQQADAASNTVKQTQNSIREKTIASPARQQKEQKEYDNALWQHRRERQGTISTPSNVVRHPDYNPQFANEVQALREKETKENQDAYFRRVAEREILGGAMEAIPWPSTIVGSLSHPNTHWYNPFSFFENLYANDNRGFFNINQTARDFYDANPEVGGIANLIGDFVVPGAAAKVLKGVGRAGKFAAADMGDAWKTMRYELAHPEAQTYGIIPDRLNPFIGKKTYDKKINQVQDLIQNQPTYVDVTLDLPNARVPATLGTGYRYKKHSPQIFLERIKAPYYRTDFTSPIPMEQGFTLIPGELKTGINWEQTNRVFTPDRTAYNAAIPDGVSGKTLQVKNIFGDTKGTAPVNLESEQSIVFPHNTRFSSPMFGEIRYQYDGTRPAIKDIGRINMRGERPTTYRTYDGEKLGYEMFEPEVRASLPPYLPKDHEVRVAAKQYVDDLERRLIGKNGKPLASVEGSYRAVSEGLPHSPQDVEFLVPENNVEALKKLFNVKSSTEMPNGFGIQVTSKEFDELLEKTADFQIIRKGKGGGATGNTAWQIYEYLHPKEAQELSRNYIRKVAKNERSQAAKNYREAVELPLSPQELFDEYMASGMNKKKYLFDMMGSPKDKHVLRKNSMGLGVGSDSKAYYDALVEKIHSEFPGAKTLAEQGYKLDYTNVEANKKFLEYWGLPEYYASKPEQMRIIVEQQMHAYQTVHRGSNIAIPGQSGKAWVNTPVEDRIEGALKLNVDAGGGSSAGPGANTTNQIGKTSGDTGLIREVEIARQLPLTYKPEVVNSIKNPEDLVNRIKNIKELSKQNESKLRALNDLQHQDEMDRLARELDLPFWTEERNYSSAGNYVGITGYDDIAGAIRYNGDVRGGAFEITKPFKFKDNYASSRWLVDRGFEEEFYNNLMNAAETNPDLVNLINRRQKLFEIRDKLNKRRNRTNSIVDFGKHVGIFGSIGAGALAGLTYGATALDKYLNEKHAKEDPLWFKDSAKYYQKQLDYIKDWDVNESPNKNMIDAIEHIERYKDEDFNKMSKSERLQFKKDIIDGLKETIDSEIKLYNYGIANSRSVEQIGDDIKEIENNSRATIELYLLNYEKDEMKEAKTEAQLNRYKNAALKRAKTIRYDRLKYDMSKMSKK